MPDYRNPQSLNRYSYVVNNPLRYTDPTGHMSSEGDGGGCGKKCKTYVEQRRKKADKDFTPTLTATPGITPTVTPACWNPSNRCATTVAGQATYVGGQPTMLAWQCQHYPCYGNLTATSTPTATPISNNDSFPVNSTIPGIFNPGFAPTADAIWDIILGALPLINMPATSLNQIVYNTVNAVINGTSNALTNTGSAVNEAIGNGLNYGPVMPVFVLPSPYDLFPVTSQQPAYN